MTDNQTKLKRQQFLHATIEKYLKSEPRLTEREIAEIIVWELGDIRGLLKEIKKLSPKKVSYEDKVKRELSKY